MVASNQLIVCRVWPVSAPLFWCSQEAMTAEDLPQVGSLRPLPSSGLPILSSGFATMALP